MSKTVYFTITTHPNMNYDRSLKSVIWEEFPKLYRLYLNYLKEHTELTSYMQLPSQTLYSLKQCAPDVVDLAKSLEAEGRLRFMGTFFSEPLAQCMDGMSALESAELGCRVAARELDTELEGFFLQEIAYTPQIPYIIEKVGVMWHILKDWDGVDDMKPYYVEGLDGSRCIGVPLLERKEFDRVREHPESIPDNALLAFHCDMEIPQAIHRAHALSIELKEKHGFDTRWCFVKEYVEECGIHLTKRPTPCTNKEEGRTESPSYSRWISDPLDIRVHEATMRAFEYRRAAALVYGWSVGRISSIGAATVGAGSFGQRPYPTRDVETIDDYPEAAGLTEVANPTASEFRPWVEALNRIRLLLAWGTNSDARGWYPLLERRLERTDSFEEAILLSREVIRHLMDARSGGVPTADAAAETEKSVSGLYCINANPAGAFWTRVLRSEPVAILGPDGSDVVDSVRRLGEMWEHNCRFELGAYAVRGYAVRGNPKVPLRRAEEGGTIENGVCRLQAGADGIEIQSSLGDADRGGSIQLVLPEFLISVKGLDPEPRPTRAESPPTHRIIEGLYPRLIREYQLDYHIHHRAEYVLDGHLIHAEWRFYFTYPMLVDAREEENLRKQDFLPGGLRAVLKTGTGGDVYYDGPFGTIRHPYRGDSFIPPLTNAFLAHDDGTGVGLVSGSGSQSFRVHGDAGELGVCLGRSTTSGGRRKLGFQVGETITDVTHETEWYKEFFYGEYVHRFTILPFAGGWREAGVPDRLRPHAVGPIMVDASPVRLIDERVATIDMPDADDEGVAGEGAGDDRATAVVRIAGYDPAGRRLILNETRGQGGRYSVVFGGRRYSGEIGPFGIIEEIL